MTRSLLLALALARAAALLDSPGLRGTISEAAEPAGQYSVRRCEGYPADYYTSCYKKCRAVGYDDAYCMDANVACEDTKKNCFSATTSGGNACSTTATAQQCLDAAGGHDAQKGPCNY